ncbi:MAG: hypothetical protein K2O97_14390, partial [Acetatifactor sp.]|nr:hypothetical protein [Acetatifactor sp.]
MDQIFKLNQAEGIFYPAFDKYLCKDDQITLDQGDIVRLWDSLTFRGDSHFTIHWSGEGELGAYDSFLAFLSFPAEAVMKVTGIVDGSSQVLVEQARGHEDPVELKGRFSRKEGDGAPVLADLYLELDSPAAHNVVILSWLGLSRPDKEAALEASVPVWKAEWDAQIVKGCVGGIEHNMVLDKEEAEALKALVAGDEKLQRFYRANAEEAMKIDHRTILREYVPQTPGMYRFVRVRDRGRTHLEGPVLNLAIAGFLLEEASY